MKVAQVTRAQAIIRDMHPNALLVRCSRADEPVNSREPVVVWMKASVASDGLNGKPLRDYGVYDVSLTFNRLVQLDASNAKFAVALRNRKRTQVVEFDMQQVIEAVVGYCAAKSKEFDSLIGGYVKKSRGQRRAVLHIGDAQIVESDSSGWLDDALIDSLV
jgi:hypothetical protein